MKRSIACALTIALGAILTAGTASAQPDPALQGSGGYGMAGCGLGSMVIGPKPGFIQVFAATTNGTFGSQTFGITFGTSNCTDTGGGSTSAAAFVESNREVLAKDMSRGAGETISALTALAGCSDEAAVGRALQKSFTAVFPSAAASDKQVSDNVIRVLRADKSLSCTKL